MTYSNNINFKIFSKYLALTCTLYISFWGGLSDLWLEKSKGRRYNSHVYMNILRNGQNKYIEKWIFISKIITRQENSLNILKAFERYLNIGNEQCFCRNKQSPELGRWHDMAFNYRLDTHQQTTKQRNSKMSRRSSKDQKNLKCIKRISILHSM